MNLSEARVLITGSNGFIGKALKTELLSKGAHLYLFARNSFENSEHSHANTLETPICGDISDSNSVTHAVSLAEPDYVIHLAAQSHVGKSFSDPASTCLANCSGTTNILEAIRIQDIDPIILFSGSADEYGLVISSDMHYSHLIDAHQNILPKPVRIPELPVSEENPLRPLSPYGVSKVYGDMLMRLYYQAYGMKTIVARSFNIEGKGRGSSFVTSILARQAVSFERGRIDKITIGNVSTFRDFTHISDAIRGYMHLMDSSSYGEVFNIGSMRATSVLSYLLFALEASGYHIHSLSNHRNTKEFHDPLSLDSQSFFGVSFDKTMLDAAMLRGDIEFTLDDTGVMINTDKGTVPVWFDPALFRPSDNPVIIADIEKLKMLGYRPEVSVREIADEMVQSYREEEGR